MTPIGFLANTRVALRMLGALALHPELWFTAIRQVGRIATPRWWTHPPFLPLPRADYLRFRLETQYGASGIDPGSSNEGVDPQDLIVYLRWCRYRGR